ncbi:hypothetical protein OF83DRAFT_1134358 [Amylostereum chailletii]|nr:hypothetical protein OF83DRAFT_1134358 [Amylostereum chailletii]
MVASNLTTYSNLYPNFTHPSPSFVSDSVLWGLTSFYAFRAYSDVLFLNAATRVWDFTSQFLITDAQAKAGHQPTRNFAIPIQGCNNSTVAGGVFWIADAPDNAGVNGETVGPFLALSAYLFEATSNETYGSAANLSASFIRNHLYNGTIIADGFDVVQCRNTPGIYTYNSGFAIEGLSVWGNASKVETWSSLAAELISTSVPDPSWTSSAGVIIEESAAQILSDNQNGFKRFLVRGLHEAWWRSDPNSDMAKFIASYLTVQFNFMTSYATRPGSNVYSPFWGGPPLTQGIDPLSQVIAMYALNSAINLPLMNVSSNASDVSPGSAAAPAASTTKGPSATDHDHVGLIVGGVVGGLVSVLAIAGLTILALRRRRFYRQLSPRTSMIAEIDPFDVQPSTEAKKNVWAMLSVRARTTPTVLSNPTTTSVTLTSFPGSAPSRSGNARTTRIGNRPVRSGG